VIPPERLACFGPAKPEAPAGNVHHLNIRAGETATFVVHVAGRSATVAVIDVSHALLSAHVARHRGAGLRIPRYSGCQATDRRHLAQPKARR
jgi:hypothetical protein